MALFGLIKKKENKDVKVSDLPKPFNEGFKVNFSELKKCVLKKEIDKNNNDCKKMLKELKIDLIEDAM